MKRLIAFLSFALPLAAQSVNPTTQIQWNRLTGVGSPASNGFVCTSNSIGTATNAIQGEMYTDQAGPHYWTCAKPGGTPAWFQVDNPGNATIIQVNGDPTSPVSPVDLNDTTPAADSGYINAKVRKSGASVSFEVPNSLAPALQPVITPPVAGQYVILYPHAATPTGYTSNVDSHGGTMAVGPLCSLSQNSSIVWNGFTLADYGINPANVTAVYAGSVNGFSATAQISACFFSPAPYVYASPGIGASGSAAQLLGSTSTTGWGMAQSPSVLTSLTGADIATASISAQVQLSAGTALQSSLNVSSVYLIVYYSGTPVTSPTNLNISYPLNYNYSSNTLSIDPSFPSYFNATTVANLPPALGAFPQIRAVYDGASATDCSTGGGTYYVLCQRTQTGLSTIAWTAFTGGGGGSGTVTNVGTGAGLTGGPCTTTCTVQIDYAHAGTYTAKQTQPAPIFSDLAGGGVQCLQTDNTGQVSGTGAACGSGGGGTIGGSGTANWYALWTASTNLGNGNLDDGVTTAGLITAHEPFQVVCSACATQMDLPYNAGHTPTPGSSTTASFAPDASGNGTLSEAGAAYSRICTAANAATNTGCQGTGSGSLNVNGTPVSSPNLQDSATVTYSVSGSNIQATATGGSAPSGSGGVIQIANTAGTALDSDPTIKIDKTGHTINVGTLGNHVSIGALGTPTNWNLDTTTPSTAANSIGAVTTSKAGLLSSFGSLVNQSSWTSLANYTAHGTTPSVSGGTLVFSGGAGDLSQTLDWTSSTGTYATTAALWTMSVTFVVGTRSTSSVGVGPGIRSNESLGITYDLSALLDVSTKATSGQLQIYGNFGSGPVLLAATGGGFTYSAGDTVRVTLSRQYYNIYAWAENLTTPGTGAYINYQFSLAPGASTFMPNAGHFAIYNYGGTQTVTAFSASLMTPVNPLIAFVGDSKMAGYFQSSGTGYGQITPFAYQFANADIFAGGGDSTTDVINNLPEIIAHHPSYVILSIGRNDVCNSVPLATAEANYQTIVNSLAAATPAIPVYNLILWESSCANSNTFNSWVSSTYPTTIIDPNLQSFGSSVVLSDGVHPNNVGAMRIAGTIANVMQSISGLNDFGYYPPWFALPPRF